MAQPFDIRRTQVAQTAFDFSKYFMSTFGAVRVLGAVPRRPELAAPEGMSTGGGKAARQPICLQAETPNVPVVTVGWVDLGQRRASMRTYRCLNGLHQARYRGRTIDIDQASYNAFFDQAKALLGSCGLLVTDEDEPTSNSAPPPGRVIREAHASGADFWTYAAIAFVAFVIGAFAGGLAVYARFVGF